MILVDKKMSLNIVICSLNKLIKLLWVKIISEGKEKQLKNW